MRPAARAEPRKGPAPPRPDAALTPRRPRCPGAAALGLASERREDFLEIYEGLPRREQVPWLKQEALDKMQRNEEWEQANAEYFCSHLSEVLNLG